MRLPLASRAARVETVAAEATPVPVATPDATTASANPAPAVQPGAIIPIIVMDDAKLTDAIRNLARMAGLNYMLDPRIGFGQVGPDGKIVAEPTVSIRWENITAEQALNALLNNYSLQLVEDPKSKIARVTVRDPAASNAKPNPPWTGSKNCPKFFAASSSKRSVNGSADGCGVPIRSNPVFTFSTFLRTSSR